MDVICLEDKAFQALLDKIIAHIKQQNKIIEDKWISGEEAMHKMRITSRTTLQKLRDDGSIRYTQPEKKIILYDTDSINQYLNKHAKDTF